MFYCVYIPHFVFLSVDEFLHCFHLWLFWIMSLWTFTYKDLFRSLLSILLNVCLLLTLLFFHKHSLFGWNPKDILFPQSLFYEHKLLFWASCSYQELYKHMQTGLFLICQNPVTFMYLILMLFSPLANIPDKLGNKLHLMLISYIFFLLFKIPVSGVTQFYLKEVLSFL